ncbi:hypothetical protein KQX54_000671 [Cotesia glomerata]|uniref:Uncharacterized protein n=1 Tax=Cotesia glomerata TaxID=32391 RepID=A0AAV7I8T4_COTGL|nr:hypothetical protein KQX54_000671 [Cotesia glomerata]
MWKPFVGVLSIKLLLEIKFTAFEAKCDDSLSIQGMHRVTKDLQRPFQGEQRKVESKRVKKNLVCMDIEDKLSSEGCSRRWQQKKLLLTKLRPVSDNYTNNIDIDDPKTYAIDNDNDD